MGVRVLRGGVLLSAASNMINVRWFRIADGKLHASEPQVALDAWKKEQGTFWADVEGYTTDELDAWLRTLGVNDTAREYCLAAGDSSHVVPHEDAVFFRFPVHRTGAESQLTDLVFLCMDRLLVTVHREPVTLLEGLAAELSAGRAARQETTSGLVSTMLLAFSRQSTHLASSLRESINALDERMDQRPDAVGTGEILDRKRALRRLDTAVGEQAAMIALLGAADHPLLSLSRMAERTEAAARNMSFADRALDRLEKHLSDVQQRYDANRQEKTNERLAVLTVISAIFLPLTLVTGIYGMNFDHMPELHVPHAYPLALGAMVVIAGGLYWYFRKNGWLD